MSSTAGGLPADANEHSLARSMIEVHGMEAAAAVAWANNRAATRAAQLVQAESWIRVLGVIQRCQTDRAMLRQRRRSLAPLLTPDSTQG